MSLFRKIFGSKLDKSEVQTNEDERSKYMPDFKLPIDERFTINFKANGGKFLYCENIKEVNENLKLILDENNWNEHDVMMFDKNLIEVLLNKDSVLFFNDTKVSKIKGMQLYLLQGGRCWD